MTKDQWRVAWKAYHSVVNLPEKERPAFLVSLGGDAEVIATVISLLEGAEASPDAIEVASRIGKRVGRYSITGRLGRGGMGEVYSARDVELGRRVALKFLNPDSIGHRSAVDRFIREAQAASALNHPNIVTVYEVIRSESDPGRLRPLFPSVPGPYL